ncbi:MAG: NAD(P)-dependent oxidoreductase, partial [Planctomycetota bacterium]|nr:NAD(P)-dependent oxidoreductase [Planctomycetota bacterium]
RRGLGFNMKVIYHNRHRKQIDDPAIEATYVSKDELLRNSDYLVVVVPLNEETRDLISFEDFEKMKSTAVFVNIARGGVVNTDAITQALQTNQIYAAGLDVTEPEPLPRNHPLLKQQNLTIAPHLGSATVQTRQKMLDLSLANLLNGIEGKTIVSSVM